MILVLAVMAVSCSNNDTKTASTASGAGDSAAKKQSFFRVTAYLKGQLQSIKGNGVTPIKYTTVNGRTDSAFIKFEDLDSTAKEFTATLIDSTNLVGFFSESKFLDQTINAFTYTYDPIQKLPDSVQLQHWDVYIDPEKGKVKRVYIIKKNRQGKTLQLTWVNNEWFNTTTIKTNSDGTTAVEKEEKISWAY